MLQITNNFNRFFPSVHFLLVIINTRLIRHIEIEMNYEIFECNKERCWHLNIANTDTQTNKQKKTRFNYSNELQKFKIIWMNVIVICFILCVAKKNFIHFIMGKTNEKA